MGTDFGYALLDTEAVPYGCQKLVFKKSSFFGKLTFDTFRRGFPMVYQKLVFINLERGGYSSKYKKLIFTKI